MLQLLIAAAEPSKVPFYIAGGALAVWAVVLAGLGLREPRFPGGEGGARGVIGITAGLMVIAMAMAIVTSN
jgi:hypothetical protein